MGFVLDGTNKVTLFIEDVNLEGALIV